MLMCVKGEINPDGSDGRFSKVKRVNNGRMLMSMLEDEVK